TVPGPLPPLAFGDARSLRSSASRRYGYLLAFGAEQRHTSAEVDDRRVEHDGCLAVRAVHFDQRFLDLRHRDLAFRTMPDVYPAEDEAPMKWYPAPSAEEHFDGVEVAGEEPAVGELSVPEAEGVGVQHVEGPAAVFGRHPGGEHDGVAVAQDPLRCDGDRVAALLAEPLEGADHLVDAVELAGDGRPAG